MKHLSWPLVVIGVVQIGAAVSLPLQVLYLYALGPGEISFALSRLTTLNWMLMASGLMTGVLAFRGSQWLLLAIPINLFIMLWNNIVVGSYGLDFSFETAMLAAVGMTMVMGLVFHPSAMEILKDPKRRFSRALPRREVEMAVVLRTPKRPQALHFKTFDISETGAFLTSTDLDFSDFTDDLDVDHLEFSWTDADGEMISIPIEVVRTCPRPKGRYPQGLGVRFAFRDSATREQVKSLMAKGPPVVRLGGPSALLS